MSHTRAALLACLGLLSCTPELATSTSPGAGWPDLAAPPVGRADGRDDAALIVAIDDPALGGRPGAFEVASGWWRYLVGTRGLPRRRVLLLRNEEATVANMRAAIERLEERADTGSLLWLVFIGSGDSPSSGGEGALRGADGQALPFVDIREALGAGLHESAFMLVDACAEQPPEGRVSGLPAVLEVDETMRFHVEQQLAKRTYYLAVSDDDPTGMLSLIAAIHGRVEQDIRRNSATMRNTFVVTAGLAEQCGSALAGQPWPALAYAGLGALQGWADADEDGHVSATELATYAQSVVAELDDRPPQPGELRPRLHAGGVDLILADVQDRWVYDRRRRRLAPEALSQTPTSLTAAASMISLQVEDMVPVPAGRFMMGCKWSPRLARSRRPELCESDEFPQREIELGGFAIDRTEVHWRDYRQCIEAGVCPPLLLDRCWVWTGRQFERGAELPTQLFGDDYPVMCVSWPEAQLYCEALGKRLPTEAEWERAARGTDERSYPWGDTPPNCSRAAMHGCSDFTIPVGSRPAGASPVGALDMSGNVSEWIADWWAEDGYAKFDTFDPQGPREGEVRAVRGGSFYDGDSNLRTSYRYGIDPLARISTVGFRCAR